MLRFGARFFFPALSHRSVVIAIRWAGQGFAIQYLVNRQQLRRLPASPQGLQVCKSIHATMSNLTLPLQGRRYSSQMLEELSNVAAIVLLRNEAGSIEAELESLKRHMVSLLVSIEDAWALDVRSRSHLFPLPDTEDWRNPCCASSDRLLYEMTYPRTPRWRSCFYHKTRFCRNLCRLPEDDVLSIPGGMIWLQSRNHIWRPCPLCLAEQ